MEKKFNYIFKNGKTKRKKKWFAFFLFSYNQILNDERERESLKSGFLK